ncbi:iron complex transport system permease protein [Pseudidiomarina maritima]|jgi:iron complex transport system permease protein|uniref:Iron complex transport system permease protein n=1 Tax=Pseudidiomarina maritima TaxID=519453 RepID=A0A1I6I2F9_9GAMM|nr:iron ABC transporter permease [Pseudidiomarina maritima]SFR60818.1 iron complex transport system permease protein [Pseudidiomarina maritima]
MMIRSFVILVFALMLTLWHLGSGGESWSLLPRNELETFIFNEIRLPRIILAFCNGVALGLAGSVLQLLLRNPLAEPGITGIAGGAALATVATLYLGAVGPVSWWLPAVGLLGGIVTLGLLWLLSGRQPQGIRIILVGVALSAISGALIAVVLNLAPNPFAFQEWALWLMGSVSNRGWAYVWLILPLLIVSLVLLMTQRHYIQAQIFDEPTVQTLGFNEAWSKFLLLLVTALLVSASVVTAGIIGFIGLVAPHLVRLLGLRRPNQLIYYSGAVGGILLVGVDALVQTIDTRVELQLGVVIALIGAPWLLLLLHRSGRT